MKFQIKLLLTLVSIAVITMTGCRTKKLYPISPDVKPATKFTIEENLKVKESLPFDNTDDFVNANRGFLDKDDPLVIYDASNDVVWSLEEYKTYIDDDKESPYSVNPSLWRNAQLNMKYGLFEVIDGIYQVRSYDLSNITFIRGETGWIVFDPLISPETAAAALKLINNYFLDKYPEEPVREIKAVIYSHSHVDHYGGVKGIVSQEDVEERKVEIIAPEGFTEHAVSENVIAGNAMARRAIYMYGALLPRNKFGGVNGGLGMTTSTGVSGLILPTHEIIDTGESYPVDGVNMVFQMTPGTEAPAEMNTWFPDMNALWMAENTCNTMHNILTLRGAQVRDALKWAKYLNETIELYGDDVVVKFQSHHWPLWDNDKIINYFEKQRDVYKYLHDQTVRLMNHGYTGEEISEQLKLPESLDGNWSTRNYYGTLRHNSRAIYQYYMGWYDGHPSDLNNYPPEVVAKKYVDFMGGAEAVITKAKESYSEGDYRWVAEVMKHVVFALDDQNSETYLKAKYILADALEQLGYQAESGPWRSVYLQGAYELRNGLPTEGGTQTATPDTICAMTPEMLFDYWGVRLNPDKVKEDYTINLTITDHLNPLKKYSLSVTNSVLNYTSKIPLESDVDASISRDTLDLILLGEITYENAMSQGLITINSGDKTKIDDFVASLDTFDFWFNIVTP